MNKTTSLNPILKKALNSLDLQLENELQRYRKKRRKEQAEGLVPSTYSAPPISTPLFINLKSIPDLISNHSSSFESGDQLLPSNPSSPSIKLAQSAHDSGLNGGQNLKLPTFENTNSSPVKITTKISLEEISSLIHQPKPKENEENLVIPPVENKPPHEYLESSEQLLASLQQEEKQELKEETKKTTKKPKSSAQKTSFFKYLATPLGIGSLLLLFVSSALLSSLILSPESFSYLGLNNLILGNKSTPDVNSLESNNSPPKNSNSVVTNGTNLTTQEFTPIELENLSTLESNTKSAPTPVVIPPVTNTKIPNNPAPVPTTAPTTAPTPVLTNNDLASVLLPPSLRSQGNQTYIDPPTVPLPPNSNSSENPTTNNSNNKYLVVIPYGGDRSLDQVRQVVKEAFVRDFPEGKKIQIATFANQNEAQQFVTKLAKSGLSASVYPLP